MKKEFRELAVELMRQLTAATELIGIELTITMDDHTLHKLLEDSEKTAAGCVLTSVIIPTPYGPVHVRGRSAWSRD